MILEPNSLITITLGSSIAALVGGETLGSEFSSYFTTEMSPMFTSVNEVRRLIGSFICEISNDIINQIILEHSIIAIELANCLIDDTWKIYAGRWVLYRSAIVTMYNTDEFKGSADGKIFKQLGDFSVSKGGESSKNAGLGKLINWLECEAFKFEFSVVTCSRPLMNCLGLTDNDAMPHAPSLPGLARRGELDPNSPLIGRRWISDFQETPRGNNRIIVHGRIFRTNIGTRRDHNRRRVFKTVPISTLDDQ